MMRPQATPGGFFKVLEASKPSSGELEDLSCETQAKERTPKQKLWPKTQNAP